MKDFYSWMEDATYNTPTVYEQLLAASAYVGDLVRRDILSRLSCVPIEGRYHIGPYGVQGDLYVLAEESTGPDDCGTIYLKE